MKRALQRILIFIALIGTIGLGVWFLNHEDTKAIPIADAAKTIEQPVSGHEQMLALLEQVKQLSLVNDPYFQTATLQQDVKELESLPAKNSVRRFELNFLQGQDYRRLGQVDSAIKHMLIAEQISNQPNVTLTDEERERLNYEIGLTFLQKGETENCLHCATGESCILPIQKNGIHTQRAGSTEAMKYFSRILQKNPENMKVRWLVNLAAMTLGVYPEGVAESMRIPGDRFLSGPDFSKFTDVSRQTGLRLVNCGGGVVAEDFDNDGLFDVLTSTWDPGGQIHAFRNQGDGTFADVTESSGLKGITGGINMVQADFDNDGHVDVFVVRGAWLDQNGRLPNSLLRNVGGGQFQDVTIEMGLNEVMFPTSNAAWSDFDRDGDPDLFVGNEGAPCQLFRNDGEKGFTDVARSAGVTNNRSTKGSTWGDFDDDGWPDLYVSNLQGANRCYRNLGNGTFTDVARQLEVDQPEKSFPTWFWDVNNDGHQDLFVASYRVGLDHVAGDFLGQREPEDRDRLYLNSGDGQFTEVGAKFGLNRVTQPMGCNFGDLDNDGFLDFYLGTGYPDLDALMPNMMFHNLNGTGFEDVSISGGFAHLQKGHGTAFVDFDNDGDQDVFMQMGGAYPADAFGNVLYQNPGFGNQWIRVKLVGVVSNRSALGSRIRVDITENGSQRSIYRWVNSGGSFGANSLQQQFGLGTATQVDTITVKWPTGEEQVFRNIPAARLIEIREGSAEIAISEPKPMRQAE